MNKRELKNQNALLKMQNDYFQQQLLLSRDISEIVAQEQSSETGTLAKKRLESNRISSERKQNDDYREMKRELISEQQQKDLKTLFKKMEELEKRMEKLQSKLEKEIIQKEDCIRNIEKKAKKQGNAIKQIEDIFLTIAISKKAIAPGTSFKNMVKAYSYDNKKDILSLIGKN